MQWQQNQAQTVKKVNPDEFVDLALKNAANYKFQIAQRVGVGETVNMDAVKSYYVMLVNDAESACIGCRFIHRTKRKFAIDELSSDEEELMVALKKYFRATLKLKSNAPLEANVEVKARGFLREAIEGGYDSKVNERREEILNDYSIPIKDKEFSLANYRYQLMLESIRASKPSKLDLDM